MRVSQRSAATSFPSLDQRSDDAVEARGRHVDTSVERGGEPTSGLGGIACVGPSLHHRAVAERARLRVDTRAELADHLLKARLRLARVTMLKQIVFGGPDDESASA